MTTPVNVVSGFLGSGKTTLIARLLQDPELANTAIIVNEFGEVGLDRALVEPVRSDVVLLAQGCLCCALNGNLATTLEFAVARDHGIRWLSLAHSRHSAAAVRIGRAG
jgi:G3E family GTPase